MKTRNAIGPDKPEVNRRSSAFELKTRKAIGPDKHELEMNPRSRSAKLRVAVRTDAPAGAIDAKSIGMPQVRGAI